MLESARKLLEIFAAWLENCSNYMLLGLARILFENELLENARLGFYFARRALVSNSNIWRRLRVNLDPDYKSFSTYFSSPFRLSYHRGRRSFPSITQFKII